MRQRRRHPLEVRVSAATTSTYPLRTGIDAAAVARTILKRARRQLLAPNTRGAILGQSQMAMLYEIGTGLAACVERER
jgi:hypothetical protein